MTTLRDRVSASNPATVAENEKANQKEYALSRWSKNRGPKHFKGVLTIDEEPRVKTYDNKDTGGTDSRDVMVVHIGDADIYETNPHNPYAEEFEVGVPAIGKNPSKNSELVMTTESAQKAPGGQLIKDYFDLDGKLVEMKADVLVLPPKKGEQYNIEIFFYSVLSVANGGAQISLPAGPDPENTVKLATWCIGKTVKECSAVKLGQATVTLGIKDDAITGLYMSGMFLEYAESEGLIAVGADGKFIDSTA